MRGLKLRLQRRLDRGRLEASRASGAGVALIGNIVAFQLFLYKTVIYTIRSASTLGLDQIENSSDVILLLVVALRRIFVPQTFCRVGSYSRIPTRGNVVLHLGDSSLVMFVM